MKVTKDKRVLIDNVFLSILKLIVVLGIVIISVWCTTDLYSACICSLTLMATIIFDAFLEKKHIGELDFGLLITILINIFIIIDFIYCLLLVLGIYFSKNYGFTFDYYKILATTILSMLSIFDIIFEILISTRAND